MLKYSLQKITLLFIFLLALMISPVISFSEIIDAQIKGVDDGIKTSKQQDYKEAVLFAKREAIERAGVRIKSITTVKDFVLNSDYIESKAEAVLLPGYNIVDIGYAEDGTYQIVLIGKIAVVNQPVIKEQFSEEPYREDKNLMGSFEDGRLNLTGWINMGKKIGGVRGEGGFQKVFLDRTHGADGTKNSISMYFKLGTKRKKTFQKHPIIAIIKNELKRNLSKYSGIIFYIKATKDMVILFGLEDIDIGNNKEERWNRNIFVTRGWEKKRISFNSLTLNRPRAERFSTNQILDPKQIESIYWTVHETNVKRGTKGKIWLDEISFY